MKSTIWRTRAVIFTALLLGIFATFLSSCNSSKKMEGEVFIATKGGQNIKLGLVNVTAIPEKVFEASLKEQEAEIKTTIEKTESIANDCNDKVSQFRAGTYKGDKDSLMTNCLKAFRDYESLPEILSKAIPKDSISTVTNSDGKFTLNLPNTGKYTILAKGKRTVGDSEEKYFWLETADTSKDNQNIILSNNNLVQTLQMKLLFKAN